MQYLLLKDNGWSNDLLIGRKCSRKDKPKLLGLSDSMVKSRVYTHLLHSEYDLKVPPIFRYK